MMAGIFFGGKYTKSATVDFFLLLSGYKYNYIYPKFGGYQNVFQEGNKDNCNTNGMIHAAPLKLVNWEWEDDCSLPIRG